MLIDSCARSLEGAYVNVFLWGDCPDGVPEEESYFFSRYLEMYIFGDGTHKKLGYGYWRIIFVCPKDGGCGIPLFESDFLFIEMENGCDLADIEIGEGMLRDGPDAQKHLVIIIDFELPDGDILKKIVALEANGYASEIPDETLQ